MSEVRMMLLSGCVLLLAGCAGGRSEFGCRATSSDSCMTMEQANEKAKGLEEGSETKPAATALPRLAEGPFSAIGRDTGVTPIASPSRRAALGTKAAGSAPVAFVIPPLALSAAVPRFTMSTAGCLSMTVRWALCWKCSR